ncbi:MAG: hypothetical protein D3926_04635 [Desulfobacteraceae bacterium]|nr:MAG: hypothetical protein D3926_04635 [Desulfobacteraceae bacterium]
MKIFEQIKNRFGGVAKTVDNYQEAIAFAEAGEHEHAASVIKSNASFTQQGQWLLVISDDMTFTPEMMDYALEMAGRLSYKIYALNASPVPPDQKPVFESGAKEHTKRFRDMALERGIDFKHGICFCDADQAAEQAGHEVGHIDYIISEGLEDNRLRDENRLQDRPARELLVYSMA